MAFSPPPQPITSKKPNISLSFFIISSAWRTAFSDSATLDPSGPENITCKKA
jgi:hypothetical protein